MPLYEYECEKCGHRFEKIQKFSDPPIEKCPTCGKPVHKQVSSPAFQFKGTGWYVTDYAKKSGGSTSPASSDKSDKSATSDSTQSGTKKTESSPAKSDTKS